MSGLFCTRRRGTARLVTLRPRPCVPAQHPAGFTGLSGGGRRARAGTFRGERRAATRGLTCWFHQCAPTKPAKCPNCSVSTSRAPPAIPPLLLDTPLLARAAGGGSRARLVREHVLSRWPPDSLVSEAAAHAPPLPFLECRKRPRSAVVTQFLLSLGLWLVWPRSWKILSPAYVSLRADASLL